jgi:hypothetical protein
MQHVHLALQKLYILCMFQSIVANAQLVLAMSKYKALNYFDNNITVIKKIGE